MIPKMEDDLFKLQNSLMQNFEILQGSVENFLENNNKLLNIYRDNAYDEQRPTFTAYKDYMGGLFEMLVKTTDFIKTMMLGAQNTINTHDTDTNVVSKLNDLNSWETTSNASVTTVTGRKNGFSYVNKKYLPSIESNKNGVLKQHNGYNELHGVEEKPNLPYGKVDTSMLQAGSIIPKAHVTSVQLDKLCFYIGLPHSQELEELFRLYSAKNRTRYQCPPTAGIIFGMKIDEGIVRAIRCKPVSSGKVFLLDFGDIVDVTKDVKNMYYLTQEEQNIPGQAILCRLHCPNGMTKSEMDDQRERLQKLLYQHTSFLVVGNVDGILELDFESNLHTKNEYSARSNISSPLSTSSTDEVPSSSKSNQLTFEEMEMLNEEPASTSNALMAVMGHIPKDDQRICRFYDPVIDTCFKGKNCRQQHIPLREDYITKDIVPANAYSELTTMVATHYDANRVLKVTVTHLATLEYFYGIVLNTSTPDDPYIWNDKDIPAADYLKKLPLPFDIVLAKFNDGCWYRAQVIDIDEHKKSVHVFYIDYGNRQNVPLKNLARCSEFIAKLPAQAQQFRLADIRIIPEEKEAQLRGMGLLCDLLLNNDVNVIVVSHYEDLVVRFIDEALADIPDLLSGINCVEKIEMLQV